jgi:hypothetical protein
VVLRACPLESAALAARLQDFSHLENFLYFSRCGMTLSMPNRRFLSSS